MVYFTSGNTVAIIIFVIISFPLFKYKGMATWQLWVTYLSVMSDLYIFRGCCSAYRVVIASAIVAPLSWFVAAVSHFTFNPYRFAVLGGSLVVGVHFSFLDKLHWATTFMLNPVVMQEWGVVQWGVFMLLIGYVCCLCVIHVSPMSEAGLSGVYAVSYGVFILVTSVTTVAIRNTHTLHLHHYIVALILLPMTRFNTWVATISTGMLTGVVIDGVVGWGVVMPWTPNNNGEEGIVT